ncbi:unnamed protein product [Acidithrix sp. C25]|nr:unnamed protein product [Acidithrix sp. C25]
MIVLGEFQLLFVSSSILLCALSIPPWECRVVEIELPSPDAIHCLGYHKGIAKTMIK